MLNNFAICVRNKLFTKILYYDKLFYRDVLYILQSENAFELVQQQIEDITIVSR